MPTSHPRVQVTVDPELAEALGHVPSRTTSQSRLIRDLALRGARDLQDEEERRRESIEYLRGIALGTIDHDFSGAAQAHAGREAGYE